jgi:WhiB family transcriptional regulator, redox-sensing transcriptional regulator
VAIPKLSLAADPEPFHMEPADLIDLLKRPEWMAQAACKGEPAQTFFPERGESSKEAKAICSTCAVQAECRAYALEDLQTVGIWGGTSGRDRSIIHRQSRRNGSGEVDPSSPRLGSVTVLR